MNSELREVVRDTLAMASELGITDRPERALALAQIASALIMSRGMQTVSDVGPALEKISTALNVRL